MYKFLPHLFGEKFMTKNEALLNYIQLSFESKFEPSTFQIPFDLNEFQNNMRAFLSENNSYWDIIELNGQRSNVLHVKIKSANIQNEPVHIQFHFLQGLVKFNIYGNFYTHECKQLLPFKSKELDLNSINVNYYDTLNKILKDFFSEALKLAHEDQYYKRELERIINQKNCQAA